MIQYIELDN